MENEKIQKPLDGIGGTVADLYLWQTEDEYFLKREGFEMFENNGNDIIYEEIAESVYISHEPEQVIFNMFKKNVHSSYTRLFRLCTRLKPLQYCGRQYILYFKPSTPGLIHL